MNLVTLARAFSRVLREDGAGAAARKVRRYFELRRLGSARNGRYLDPAWTQLSQADAFFPPLRARQVFARTRVALIGDLDLPQCRKYRVEQLADLLEGLGIKVSIAHYLDAPAAVQAMQRATHLMEYRLPLHELCHQYRHEARRLGLPILYDIDDPLFSFPAYATYGNMDGLPPQARQNFLRQTSHYLAMLNGADVLTVSTPALQAHLAQLTARPVYLRRNFADQESLRLGQDSMTRQQGQARPGFTVCFASGARGHEQDFAVIAPQVFDFLARHSDARLKIIGHFPKSAIPQAALAQTEFVPFSDYAAYLDALAGADCAVLPLAPDLFNQCKSAVRAIDAAAVALPILASDIGDNRALIQDGETGFLISHPDQWGILLDRLYADRALTQQMGHQAREALARDWSASEADHIISPQILTWLRG